MAGSAPASPKLSFAQKILSQDMLRRCSGFSSIDFTTGKDALPLNENEAIALAWALQQDGVVAQSVKFTVASGSLCEGGLKGSFLAAVENSTTLRKIEANGGIPDEIQTYLERNNALKFCSKASLIVGSYKLKPTTMQLKSLALALQQPQSNVESVDFFNLDTGVDLKVLLLDGEIEKAFYDAFNHNTKLVKLRIGAEVSDRLRNVVKRNVFLASKRNAETLTLTAPQDNPSEARMQWLLQTLRHPQSKVSKIELKGVLLQNGTDVPLDLTDGVFEEMFHQFAVDVPQLTSIAYWGGLSDRLKQQVAENKARSMLTNAGETLTLTEKPPPILLKALFRLLADEPANFQLKIIDFVGHGINLQKGEYEALLLKVIEANHALCEIKCKGGFSDSIKTALMNNQPFEPVDDAPKADEVAGGSSADDSSPWPVLAAVTSAFSSLMWGKEEVVEQSSVQTNMPTSP